MLVSTAETTTGFSLNRLLMLENIFDLGRQTVRDAMIPWSQVRYLTKTATHDQVIRLVVEHRFSRWPVLDPATGLPVGYLLAKDLIGQSRDDQNWQRLLRPLRIVGPNENLEVIMQQLQKEGGNIAVVADGGRSIGLITLEDILEEVVGRIEDEYPRLPRLFLRDALKAGGVVMDFPAETPEEAIRTLVAAIAPPDLPQGMDVCRMALERERQMPTDVGHGVAIPHARCPRLTRPLIVFGRAAEGILYGDPTREPVRLIFLVVTPAERPNVQVFLLGQLANVARSEFVRERLIRAQTPEEVFEIISAADPAVTG
jgi:mannitol/fructose-specific phosphotransferase system IIA component (Ntr-type)/predicted transcriptional regulator